ncbi:MAG: hypothetical protein JOY93_12170, partial [Acidobacteriales bacterium]|nr:hypothetical protein [Terriglobales bacterium]
MPVPSVKFVSALLFTLLIKVGFAQTVDQALAAERSKLLSSSRNLGPEDVSKSIAITVWLKQPHRDAFDNLVKQIYTKGSPQYHHFLTLREYNANFAPGARETQIVKDYLTSHNFTIIGTDKNNHYIRAEGRVADAQSAFHVQINRLQMNKEIHRAPLSEPFVSGPAAAFVESIQGLHDLGAFPTAIRPLEPGTHNTPTNAIDVRGSASPQNRCLKGVQTIHLPVPPASGPPSAVYTGLRYATDATNTCPGYNPTQLQTA